MGQPILVEQQRVGPQTVTSLPQADGVTTASRSRPRMALIGDSGEHITSEIEGLLRRRLRVAALITMAGFVIYLFRGLLDAEILREYPVLVGLNALTVAVMVGLATLLWSRWPLSLFGLRLIELSLFGAAGLFFLYLQFSTFAHGKILELASNTPGASEQVVRIAAASQAIRWFILIVIYGTFIPNTWRRCAIVVTAMAATPLLLALTSCTFCPVMGGRMWDAIFDMAILLGLGVAIAIFGSYKIGELQQEAFEARKIGQYRLKKKLGAGGMGEVYLCEHILLRRQCAIKLIRPDQAGDPTNLSRFEREVQAMATLTHWNTVEVYDYGHEDDGTFYYVMEYLPGLSLQELVEHSGPLPAPRAVHFLRQICDALSEAHAVGLIHRDVKPSNAIVCERGGVQDVAKLLDFGLVHGVGLGANAEKLTVQGTILGSPPYMAPEQAMGKEDLDARTDVYSLGALAYFLLSGEPPFVRETAMQMLVAHVHEQPRPLSELRPEVPEDVASVVMRCLSKSPADRFQNAESLERALAACDSADLWGRYEARLWWKENGQVMKRN